MELTLGFSPCPNDVFIFEALINKRLKNKYDFKPVIEDVENLNLRAFHQELSITKLSFNAYAKVSDRYQVLSSGGALGNNCGPLLVVKDHFTWNDIAGLSIAIPGVNTTANMLLTLFAPEAVNKKVMLFSEIEDAVLKGHVDAGLIIHESRFTYEAKGLKKMADMGELWEQYTGSPLPLGCIAIRRDMDAAIKSDAETLIRMSVQHAFSHPEDSRSMINHYAAEMSEEVQQKHIALYVNDYSLDLGEKGRQAIKLLLRKGSETGIIPNVVEPVFANQLQY